MLKNYLSPAGIEKYRDIRKYIVKRVPRFYNQIIGRDLQYFPQIRVRKEHLGSRFDGKQVCTEAVKPEHIVYSFGIGRDISFDLAMIERFGVKVYAFDPTPVSKEWLSQQPLPDKFHFFDFGVADYDGVAEFFPFFDDPTEHDFSILNPTDSGDRIIKCPIYKLETIMTKLGHQWIDILKMDIEGSEYGVINDMLTANIRVHQLLVEFHHRFKNIGLQATRQAIRALNQHGYKIFSISPDGLEYSFIKV